ncbi:hypothetical protein IF1G_09791 [Cordyceps javanica]|uniref:Uncharacterized protein n=1 Tax=Cordyceps javanica TaxID=43265 RepID=A0A545VP50_9HYPO|nr:hypothetical protein IF1G_09791 [Cordyceps javanica]TQW03501.1 hypothetical protein IF2G_08799 [Cordyceps javanica]
MEDVSDPKLKEQRERHRSMVEAMFGSIDTSLLADIPVSKARSNYTLLNENGELEMMPDEDGTLKPEHSFFFRFFPIDLAHTNRINAVFLENVGVRTSIVFASKDSFRNALEWYLTDQKVFHKRVSTSPEDSSSAKLYMEELALPVPTHDETFFIQLAKLRQALPSLLHGIQDDSPTEFMSIYKSLGGSKTSLPKDMDQVSRMRRLRIKIDVWSQGIDEGLRQANREYLVDIYRQFPRRRLWLYLKQWRQMELGQFLKIDGDNFFDGPEDIVAKASRLLKCDALNNMMYFAVGNDILKRKSPGFEPWATITLDENGLKQLRKLHCFAFSRSIAKCGKNLYAFIRRRQILTADSRNHGNRSNGNALN